MSNSCHMATRMHTYAYYILCMLRIRKPQQLPVSQALQYQHRHFLGGIITASDSTGCWRPCSHAKQIQMLSCIMKASRPVGQCLGLTPSSIPGKPVSYWQYAVQQQAATPWPNACQHRISKAQMHDTPCCHPSPLHSRIPTNQQQPRCQLSPAAAAAAATSITTDPAIGKPLPLTLLLCMLSACIPCCCRC